jgi:hypothetical protein
MDVSNNLAEPPSWSAKVAAAAAQIEAPGKIAIAAIFLCWFLLDTLVVTLGSLQHGVRFYDMSALIADPSRMFFGFQGWAHRAAFGLLCIVCLAAPILPHFRQGRMLWLVYLAPLALMGVCGALLVWRTSGQFIAAPSDASGIGGNLVQFANGLVHHGSTLISRHISIGVAGYLAFVASLVLALRGIRQYRGLPK